MATCNPEQLAGAIQCLLCIKGERTSEAVKTWLLATYLGNNQTPEQLWAAATAAGYGKITLKQANQAIVYLVCTKGGGTCTPEALNKNAVAFQKFSWQQNQAAIIYFLADGAGQLAIPETLVKGAVTRGFQKLPNKALRQMQAYLLANGLTPKQVNTSTECFQCVGQMELLAMESYGYCSLIGQLVLNSVQFPLTDGTLAIQSFAVATKPQYMRMVLLCTAQDATQFYTWNPGDELDAFGVFDNNLDQFTFGVNYQASSHSIVMTYNGETAFNIRYAFGTGPFSAFLNSFNNFAMKVYYI